MDPNCIVWQSEVVRESLNPEWKEITLELGHNGFGDNWREELILQCWDWCVLFVNKPV